MLEQFIFNAKLDGRHKNICAVIPLEPEFKPMVLCEAFLEFHKLHPEWKLKLIGSGSEYKKIQTFVSEHQLQKHVMLYGPLQHSEIYDVLKRTDVVVFPSTEVASFTHVSIYSMGIPIVSPSEHVLNSEAFEDSGTYSFNESSSELTTKLNDVLQNLESNKNLNFRNARLNKLNSMSNADLKLI